MLAPALCLLLLALTPAPQQVPVADTTRAAADTQALVLPVADTTRMSPLPAPTAGAVPARLTRRTPADPAPQQTPADTLPAAAPETLFVAPPAAAPDTSAAGATDLGAVLRRVGRDLSGEFARFRDTFSFTRLLLAVLALVLTYLAVRLAMWLLERLARWRPQQAFRIRRVMPLLKFALWFAAVWIVVGSLFTGSTVVLILLALLFVAAAGVTALLFLRDLAGGLILTFEQPFQIGSRVAVGEHRGVVRQIGLRSFELATPDGATVVVPNAEVLRRSLTATQPDVPEAPVTVELAVPETVDLNEARVRVREAAYASPYVYAARPVTVALTPPEGATGRLRLRVEAYVFNAQYAQALASDVVRLAHAAFTQDGAERAPAPSGDDPDALA